MKSDFPDWRHKVHPATEKFATNQVILRIRGATSWPGCPWKWLSKRHMCVVSLPVCVTGWMVLCIVIPCCAITHCYLVASELLKFPAYNQSRYEIVHFVCYVYGPYIKMLRVVNCCTYLYCLNHLRAVCILCCRLTNDIQLLFVPQAHTGLACRALMCCGSVHLNCVPADFWLCRRIPTFKWHLKIYLFILA